MNNKKEEQEVQELINIKKEARERCNKLKNEVETKFGRWIMEKMDKWLNKEESKANKCIEEYILENPNNNLKL